MLKFRHCGLHQARKSAIAPYPTLQHALKLFSTFCLLLMCWFSIGLSPNLSSPGHHFAYAEEQPDFDIVPATPTFNTSDIQVDDISSEKISQFVQAYVQVVELIDQREAELQQAETESESLRIQHDIVAEAFSQIEETGLSQQEYLQLLGLANIDPEFGERIATQLEEIKP
ncbi:MAG: DUF4168 domain-containing protein [Thainema sp.]